MGSLVAIVAANHRTVGSATRKSIDLINGLGDLGDRRNILIKPNLCRPSSSQSGCTTDVEVVEAVIAEINRISNSNIQVVETNNFIASADETFRTLGYTDLEKRFSNVKCINLSKDEKMRLTMKGKIFRTLQVPETAVLSDYTVFSSPESEDRHIMDSCMKLW